ncbi:MAG: sulfotransferase, partial [Phycisphaerales bacterium]|nr:sulfotransferase [Phycisphaerales bacterium]
MAQRKPRFTAAPSVARTRQMAQENLKRGLVGIATEMGEQLVEDHPKRFDGYFILSVVAKENSDFGVGLKMAVKALERCPVEEAELYRLAVMHATLCGDNEAEEHWIEQMRTNAPKMATLNENPGSVEELHARYLERNSRFDEALTLIKEARAKGTNEQICDLVEGRCLYGLKRMGDAVDVFTRLKDAAGGAKEDRAAGAFALAKLYDKQGDYDLAWQAAQDGHAIMNVTHRPSLLDDVVKADTEGFTPANLKMWQRPTMPGSEAIMICAMARSGTSLMEQILSMHPDIANGGEMSVSGRIQARTQQLLDSFLPWPEC